MPREVSANPKNPLSYATTVRVAKDTDGSTHQFHEYFTPMDDDCLFHAIGFSRKFIASQLLTILNALNTTDNIEQKEVVCRYLSSDVEMMDILGEIPWHFNPMFKERLKILAEEKDFDRLKKLCKSPLVVTSYVESYIKQSHRWLSFIPIQDGKFRNCGLDAIAFLNKFNLKIWGDDKDDQLKLLHVFAPFVRSSKFGPNPNDGKTINLYYKDNHFNRFLTEPGLKIFPVMTDAYDESQKPIIPKRFPLPPDTKEKLDAKKLAISKQDNVFENLCLLRQEKQKLDIAIQREYSLAVLMEDLMLRDERVYTEVLRALPRIVLIQDALMHNEIIKELGVADEYLANVRIRISTLLHQKNASLIALAKEIGHLKAVERALEHTAIKVSDLVVKEKTKGHRITVPTASGVKDFVLKTKGIERATFQGPYIFVECQRFQFEVDGIVHHGASLWIKEAVNEQSKILHQDTHLLAEESKLISCDGIQFKINNKRLSFVGGQGNHLHFQIDGDLCFETMMRVSGRVSARASSVTFCQPVRFIDNCAIQAEHLRITKEGVVLAKSFTFKSGTFRGNVLNQGQLLVEENLNLVAAHCNNHRGLLAGNHITLKIGEDLSNLKGQIIAHQTVELLLGNHCQNRGGIIFSEIGDIIINTKAHTNNLFHGQIRACQGTVKINAKQVTLDAMSVLKGKALAITVKKRFQQESGLIARRLSLNSQQSIIVDKPLLVKEQLVLKASRVKTTANMQAKHAHFATDNLDISKTLKADSFTTSPLSTFTCAPYALKVRDHALIQLKDGMDWVSSQHMPGHLEICIGPYAKRGFSLYGNFYVGALTVDAANRHPIANYAILETCRDSMAFIGQGDFFHTGYGSMKSNKHLIFDVKNAYSSQPLQARQSLVIHTQQQTQLSGFVAIGEDFSTQSQNLELHTPIDAKHIRISCDNKAVISQPLFARQSGLIEAEKLALSAQMQAKKDIVVKLDTPLTAPLSHFSAGDTLHLHLPKMPELPPVHPSSLAIYLSPLAPQLQFTQDIKILGNFTLIAPHLPLTLTHLIHTTRDMNISVASLHLEPPAQFRQDFKYLDNFILRNPHLAQTMAHHIYATRSINFFMPHGELCAEQNLAINCRESITGKDTKIVAGGKLQLTANHIGLHETSLQAGECMQLIGLESISLMDCDIKVQGETLIITPRFEYRRRPTQQEIEERNRQLEQLHREMRRKKRKVIFKSITGIVLGVGLAAILGPQMISIIGNMGSSIVKGMIIGGMTSGFNGKNVLIGIIEGGVFGAFGHVLDGVKFIQAIPSVAVQEGIKSGVISLLNSAKDGGPILKNAAVAMAGNMISHKLAPINSKAIGMREIVFEAGKGVTRSVIKAGVPIVVKQGPKGKDLMMHLFTASISSAAESIASLAGNSLGTSMFGQQKQIAQCHKIIDNTKNGVSKGVSKGVYKGLNADKPHFFTPGYRAKSSVSGYSSGDIIKPTSKKSTIKNGSHKSEKKLLQEYVDVAQPNKIREHRFPGSDKYLGDSTPTPAKIGNVNDSSKKNPDREVPNLLIFSRISRGKRRIRSDRDKNGKKYHKDLATGRFSSSASTLAKKEKSTFGFDVEGVNFKLRPNEFLYKKDIFRNEKWISDSIYSSIGFTPYFAAMHTGGIILKANQVSLNASFGVASGINILNHKKVIDEYSEQICVDILTARAQAALNFNLRSKEFPSMDVTFGTFASIINTKSETALSKIPLSNYEMQCVLRTEIHLIGAGASISAGAAPYKHKPGGSIYGQVAIFDPPWGGIVLGINCNVDEKIKKAIDP